MLKRQPYDDYIEAMHKAYGVKPRVDAKQRRDLYELSQRLEAQNIKISTYFERLAGGLRWFVTQKGFEFIPVNVMCGTWAFNYYVKKFPREVVVQQEHDLDRTSLLYYETMIANCCAEGWGTYTEVVGKLSSYLPSDWDTIHIPNTVRKEVIDNLRQRRLPVAQYANG